MAVRRKSSSSTTSKDREASWRRPLGDLVRNWVGPCRSYGDTND
nr:MAG TPA: hypothetical protein [Caudoviricetes sp.]